MWSDWENLMIPEIASSIVTFKQNLSKTAIKPLDQSYFLAKLQNLCNWPLTVLLKRLCVGAEM